MKQLHLLAFNFWKCLTLFFPMITSEYSPDTCQVLWEYEKNCWFWHCVMTSRNGDYQNWAYSLGQISKSISTGAQYVTPDSKIYCEKVKMCRFSSGNRFFLHQIREKVKMCRFSSGNRFFFTKFVQLAMAGTRRNTVVHPPKQSVINWTWQRLSISDWSIIMIGPDGLLLVVPIYSSYSFIGGVAKNKQLHLDI